MFVSLENLRLATVATIVLLIAGCGGEMLDPLDELAQRLSDPDIELKRASAAQIAAMEHVPSRWATQLCAALDDGDLIVRLDAAAALGHTGREGLDLLPRLAEKAQSHPCAKTRHAISTATARIAASARDPAG